MGEHYALRLRRRPGRENHFRHVVRSVLDRRDGPRRRGGGRGGDLPHRRVHGAEVGHGVAHHDRAGADDRGHAAQKVCGGAVIDRHEHDAAQQASPQRDNPFGPVFAPDDDVLPAGDPRGVQARSEGVRAIGGVAVAVRPAAIAVVEDQELAADVAEIFEEVNQRTPRHSAEL